MLKFLFATPLCLAVLMSTGCRSAATQQVALPVAPAAAAKSPEKVTGKVPEKAVQIEPKAQQKDAPKDLPKEIPQEIPKEIPKDVLKELPKEVPKEIPKEVPKEINIEAPKEVPKEAPKDGGFSLDALTQLQEKYIAVQEKIVALRQHKMSLGKGDANALDAAKLGLLQSKLGIEKDQSKKLEFLQEIVKLRSESHARSQRKQKNGSGSEDDTLMQEVQLIAAQMELLKAEKK